MGQLVIRVGTDGSLHTLLKDSILDTSKFGDRKIDRITLIEFSEERQRFYVEWLLGPYGRAVHTYWHEHVIFGVGDRRKAMDNETVYFDTYEDAVKREIECVNALRLKGVRFDA